MYYKTYESKYGLAVAVCDREVCGKKLKFKGTVFYVNPRFYKDKEGDQHEIIQLLKEAVNANLVGKQAVSCGIAAGLISRENIIMIGKVPHAQAVVMVF